MSSCYSLTDEVVVSYVIGVLETLDDKECFSLEEFIEVMAAYVPGFEMIDRWWKYSKCAENAEISLQNWILLKNLEYY